MVLGDSTECWNGQCEALHSVLKIRIAEPCEKMSDLIYGTTFLSSHWDDPQLLAQYGIIVLESKQGLFAIVFQQEFVLYVW